MTAAAEELTEARNRLREIAGTGLHGDTREVLHRVAQLAKFPRLLIQTLTPEQLEETAHRLAIPGLESWHPYRVVSGALIAMADLGRRLKAEAQS